MGDGDDAGNSIKLSVSGGDSGKRHRVSVAFVQGWDLIVAYRNQETCHLRTLDRSIPMDRSSMGGTIAGKTKTILNNLA